MINIFENQSIICMSRGNSALPTGEPTYYNFPADNSPVFAFTIATIPALCAHGSGQLPTEKRGRKWL
jgi:hypothetical protein